MSCRDIIIDATEYISDNLTSDLSIESLAKRAGYSTYHFSKLFSFYVGMPVMEYVRRTRLFRAASDICAGRKIIDVAMDYGFESHSGFSKAFKKIYAYSPEEYRKRASTHRPPAPNPLKDIEKKMHGFIPKCEIVEKEGFYIAGVILRTSPDLRGAHDAPAVWYSLDLKETENRIYAKAMPKEHGEYYISFPVREETFRLVSAVRINSPEDIEEGLYVDWVEGGLYAVFSLSPVFGDRDEFAEAITFAWKYIYEVWMRDSEYSIDQERLDYEFYDERCHGDGPYSMDICIPIIKKQK